MLYLQRQGVADKRKEAFTWAKGIILQAYSGEQESLEGDLQTVVPLKFTGGGA